MPRLTPRLARWLLVPSMLIAFSGLGPLGADAATPVPDVGLGVCGALTPLRLADVDLCTHGPDYAPAAAGTGSGEPVRRREVTCLGNGTNGQRVHVLYLHGSSRGTASAALREDIRGWVEQVEWTVQASADRHGGDRRVRWLTSSCEVRVDSLRVSNGALGDFDTMVGELRAAGHDRTDRTYLAFVDATTYCGIATAPRDDRATDNRADRTAGYARVDRNCWDAGDEGHHSIAAHELLHTLGAVQRSAPHATPGAHCTDEHDLLCYDDGTGGAVRTVCRDSDGGTSGSGDAFDRLLDCGGDDYFNPAPRRGSYLDTHWNTADSARLHDPDASSSSSSSGSSDRPPSPTGDPVGYVVWLLLG